MTKAGAAPILEKCMPEFAPAPLEIQSCPEDFGGGWQKHNGLMSMSCKTKFTPEPQPRYCI